MATEEGSMNGTKSGSGGRGMMVGAMMMLGALAGLASGGAGKVLPIDGGAAITRPRTARQMRMITAPDVWGHGGGLGSAKFPGVLCTRQRKRVGRTKTCNRRRARYRRCGK